MARNPLRICVIRLLFTMGEMVNVCVTDQQDRLYGVHPSGNAADRHVLHINGVCESSNTQYVNVHIYSLVS